MGEEKIRAKKSQEGEEELFFAVLTFLHPNFFSRPFRLFPGPTNCPWVSEDALKTGDAKTNKAIKSPVLCGPQGDMWHILHIC